MFSKQAVSKQSASIFQLDDRQLQLTTFGHIELLSAAKKRVLSFKACSDRVISKDVTGNIKFIRNIVKYL